MTNHPVETQDDAFLAGYLRGLEAGTTSGHSAGYVDGLSVLDDAAAGLAATRPSRAIEWAAARDRRHAYTAPALSAQEIRSRAAESWGLPPPEPAAAQPPEAADDAVPLDDLADDDDWAWTS